MPEASFEESVSTPPRTQPTATVRGYLWKRCRRGGGHYLAGYIEGLGRVVIWPRRERRRKGEAPYLLELHPFDLVEPQGR